MQVDRFDAGSAGTVPFMSFEDRYAAYERLLVRLLDLVGRSDFGAPPADGTRKERRSWQGAARWAVAKAVKAGAPLAEEAFEPLVLAGVYEPDPSHNRFLVEPALKAFGRRRVKLALLDLLDSGTDAERAGAARAWYWTNLSLSYQDGSDTPTPESRRARWDRYADLERRYQEIALRVFVDNEDFGVRRCIIPGLDLRERPPSHPERELVERAVHIARTHPDEYISWRVEVQTTWTPRKV
jgi:hypothetical protein